MLMLGFQVLLEEKDLHPQDEGRRVCAGKQKRRLGLTRCCQQDSPATTAVYSSPQTSTVEMPTLHLLERMLC